MGLQQRKVMHDGEYFPHYYLCTYIPKGQGCDLLSQSLVNFKAGRSPHQQAWIECAVNEIKRIRELKGSYVIRALSHDERIADSERHEPISRLTSRVCNAVGGTYLPNFLEKIKDVRRLKALSSMERDTELFNAYRFSSPGRGPKHVLIIDDILTTGATMRAIITAVLKACPSGGVSIFTLAYTDVRNNVNDEVVLRGAAYAWEPNAGWMVAAEDSPAYGVALDKLKRCIMDDTFK